MSIRFSPPANQPERRRWSASPVVSHQSYKRPARLICHHSGHYLTTEESNPERISLLREQHDFPGFKLLDDRFQIAAHAPNHQHLLWSIPGVQGLAMILAALLLGGGAGLVWMRREQWAGVVEGALVLLLPGLAALAALILLLYGTYLLNQRNEIFHRQAAGRPPAISDFPLFGTYNIEIEEHYKLDFDSGSAMPPAPAEQRGTIRVDLIPEPDALDCYRTYKTTYGHLGVGTQLHAGAVACEGLQHVTFPPQVEHGHRISLRQPVAQSFAPSGEPQKGSVRFQTPYQIAGAALSSGIDQEQRSRLRFWTELQDFDSYTLVLVFRWDDATQPCGIDECRLEIPPELGDVLRVEQGRLAEGANGPEAIWRNLTFQRGELRLALVFSKPLLGPRAPASIQGDYKFVLNGAASGLTIPPDQVWNALGQPANSVTRPQINAITFIEGTLNAQIAILAQEHEFICSERLETALEPDYELAGLITASLTSQGVVIQQIIQAAPRLDPLATLDVHLRYWDIAGRRYDEQALESVDVHVVISGSQIVTGGAPLGPTELDLRVRCLHDPRSPGVAEATRQTHKKIYDEIKRVLPPAAAPAAPVILNGGSA